MRICDRVALLYMPERECKKRSREKHHRNDKAADTVFWWRDFQVKVSKGKRTR